MFYYTLSIIFYLLFPLQIVKPVSFLNNLSNKIVRPGGLNVSGVKSFLHVNTPPPKLSSKVSKTEVQFKN